MRLVMTLLVRDEEDVLESNLEFHLAMGVDHFIVTDNLSQDSSPEILREFVARGVVTVIDEPGDDYSQARWVTRMARMASGKLAADWVLHSDADEFWYAQSGSLKSELAPIPTNIGVVAVERHNFVPINGAGAGGFPGMIYRQVSSTNAFGTPLPPKVGHRRYLDVVVDQGNHSISSPKVAGCTAPGIEILHFPVRTYEQFARKIQHGGAAYERNTVLPREIGSTWRHYYAELRAGRLEDHYASLARSEEQAQAEVSFGQLRLDSRLREVLGQRLSR